MTFKSNVPERWLDNPDMLPHQSFKQLDASKKSGLDIFHITKQTSEGRPFTTIRDADKASMAKVSSWTSGKDEAAPLFGSAAKNDGESVNFSQQFGKETSTQRENDESEIKVIDHVLKQYAPYNDYENE